MRAMIQKPPGAERESKAHAAVGRAIEIGGDVKEASRKGGRMVAKGYLLWFGVMMGFGLIMSSTPWWFKALLLALGYGGYRLLRSGIERR
jgi:hypothetical protein